MRSLYLTLSIMLAGLVALPHSGAKDPKEQAKTKKNLLPNGDFEIGDTTPKHWQTIDGLTTFYVKDDDPKRGKVLRVDTDVYQKEGYDWWTKIAQGASSKDAPKRTQTVGDKYDTLAGLDGVWFWSDPIELKKGQAYWLTIDVKGPAGGMMAWLVGYPQKPETSFGADAGAFQEAMKERITGKPADRGRDFEPFLKKYTFRGQLSLAGSSPDEWRTLQRREKPFNPTSVTPDVKYGRILLYAFWPPGVYYFDNVRLTEHDE